MILVTVVALLPTSNLGVPWTNGFGWQYVNYTILVVPGALILLWIYWHLSVKNWFTGPKTTIDAASGAPSTPLTGGPLRLSGPDSQVCRVVWRLQVDLTP